MRLAVASLPFVLVVLQPLLTQSQNVSVWNSFQDETETGGAEVVYDTKGPVTIGDGVEFPLFPGGSFYDIDVTTDTITWTLKNTSHASTTVFVTTYDRYYFEFDQPVGRELLATMGGLGQNVTVSGLGPGYHTDKLTDDFNTGIPVPLEFPNGGLLVEFGPGTNITELGQTMTVNYTLMPFPSEGQASIWNTFSDLQLTFGNEVIYDVAGPVDISADSPEFQAFPAGSYYNIDITPTSDGMAGNITYTLFNNTMATDLVFPDGRFDRYYYEFAMPVRSAKLSGSGSLNKNATVNGLAYQTFISTVDAFEKGITTPLVLPYGGLEVALGGGTNLTELGQTLTLSYELMNVTVPGSVTLWNAFFDDTLTQGLETIYDLAGPVVIGDGIEFALFPGGSFYQFDFSTDGTAVMTLMNNTAATDLVFPDGRYDRYYMDFGAPVAMVEFVGDGPLAAYAAIDALRPGSANLTDLFDTGITLPVVLPYGGIVLTFGNGTNLTQLGQNLTFSYVLGDALMSDTPTGGMVEGPTAAPITKSPVVEGAPTQSPVAMPGEGEPTKAPSMGGGGGGGDVPTKSPVAASSAIMLSWKTGRFSLSLAAALGFAMVM